MVAPLGFYFNGELMKLAQKGVKIERTPSVDSAIKMLISRRVDVMINYDQMVSYFARIFDRTKFHKTPIGHTPFYFAVRNNLPLANTWIKCIDEQVRMAEKAKKLDKLFVDYFEKKLN